MLFTFQTAFFPLLILASFFDAVSSEAFPFSIPSSSLGLVGGGPPGLNYTGFDELNDLGFLWDMVDANGVDVSFVWTEVTDATVELMSGPSAQALISSVMEPLSIGLAGDETNINLPANLPNGVYHMRVTSVVNTTIGSQTTIQTLSASGADFQWTRPNTDVGCGPGLQPNAFVPIADVNDPEFTSFVFTSPYAGQNYPLATYSIIFVEWGWRIADNWGAEGITSAELQVLNATSGKPVLDNAIPVDTDTLEGFSSLWLHPVDLGLQANTQYRLQLKYVNAVQDGPVPPGLIVTHTGDVFNVIPTSVNCDAQNLLLDTAPVSSSSVSSSSTALPSSRPVASSSSNHAPSSVSTVARSSSIAVSSRPSASSAPVRPSSSITIPSASSNPVSIFSSHPISISNPSASSAPIRAVSSSSARSSWAPLSSSRPAASSSSNHVPSSVSTLARSSSNAVSSRSSTSSAPERSSSSISIPSASSNHISTLSAHPSSTPALSKPGASSAPIRTSSSSRTPSVSSTSPVSNTGKSSAAPSKASAANNSSPSSGPSSGIPDSWSDGQSNVDSGSDSSGSDTGNASSDPESGSTSPKSGSAGSGNDTPNTGSGSGSSSNIDSEKGTSGTSKHSGGGSGHEEPKQCKKKHAQKFKHQKPHHKE